MADIPGSISSQPQAATLIGTEALPLDQLIGAPVTATALTVGSSYQIIAVGSTNWTAAGAGAAPAVGTVFVCTAVGTGTGTAQQVATRRASAQAVANLSPPTNLTYDSVTRVLGSSTGDDVTLPLAGTVAQGQARAGLQTAADAARMAELGAEDSPTFAGLTIAGTATAAQFDGNLTGAISTHCRNVSGASIAALAPLTITGSQGDTTIVEVIPARADTSATMPAAGLALVAMGTNGSAAAGHLVTGGVISGTNTAAFAAGALLWVGAAGGLTATRPAVNAQPIARVGRVHATTGTLFVLPGSALSAVAFTGAYGDLTGRPDRARRHAWSAPNSYLGSAAVGSAESAAVWTITRLTVSAAGAVTATATASGVAWTNYLTAIYS